MGEARDREGRQLRLRVGGNIRNAREKAGLTQVQLAGLLREEQPTISRWEVGLSSPRPEALMGLARALGVTVADLFVPLADEPETNGDDAPVAA